MSKAIRMAKLSTIISAIGTILVVRLLNPPQHGPYSLSLAVPSIFKYVEIN